MGCGSVANVRDLAKRRLRRPFMAPIPPRLALGGYAASGSGVAMGAGEIEP